MPEFLTDEEAAMIWSGQTASIAGVEPAATTTVEKAPETPPAEEPIKKEILISDDDITNIFSSESTEEEDEDEEEIEEVEETTTTTEATTTEPKKAGRKPVDLLSVVSQLIEEEVLQPFEEGTELKTIEDAKDLIRLNLQSRESITEDQVWESKVKKYSPQVQAILHYAEQGGTDIAPLLKSIAEVETTVDLTLDSEKSQEEIVRQVLRIKNFDDEEIEDQIATLKDLDKLKAKAEKFLPELKNMKQQQLTMLMQKQKERQDEAAEATRTYLTTVQETLSKDAVKGVKLQREDKAKIYEALAAARHTSLNGVPTNGFVHSLEEMQFGKNADYELFLSVVHHAVDPEGFMEKIRASLKNEVNADTVKKLKSSKSTTANTEESFENKPSKKNVITRSTFKNPFG